ncbi:MAG: ankyrin repeat domain-containing protein [Gemmatimonadota bacterium]
MNARSGVRRRSGALSALLASTLLLAATGPESPVADAAMRGEREAVRALLSRGADVNAAQGDGMTALHWAAERGDAELARLLLEAGAEVGTATRNGAYTPLHLAARVGDAATVRALLDAGADVRAATTTGGALPLHLAAASASAEAVEALLAAGADADAPDEVYGQTALMYAAAAGRLGSVQSLLAAGADVSLTSKVVDVAERAQRDRGAQVERNRRVRAARSAAMGNSNAGTAQGRGGQGAAAGQRPGQGRRDDAEYLPQRMQEDVEPLSYGQLVGGQGGLAALHYAVRQGHGDVAHALLAAGADIDQVTGGDHTSPLLMACINGYFDLALELLDGGADVNLASDAGATPLFAVINTHWAPKSRYPQQMAYQNQRAGYMEMMETFLKAGADPNARLTKHLWYLGYNFDLLQVDVAGATPFWRAAYATDVPAMRLLVANGADPNIPTKKVPARRGGESDQGDISDDPSGLPPVPIGGPAVYPIHAASGVGYGEGFAGNAHRHVPDGWVPAVRYLVEEQHADVNARDANGYSALHHAAARGDVELIQYLVDHGADVTVVSRRGQTAADMANGPVQRVQPWPEALALLERLGSKNNNRCVSCE